MRERLASVALPSRLVSEQQGTVNLSGLEPVGTKVLVLTDQIAEVTAGGIHLPGEKVERETLGITKGTLVAVGGGAFSDWPNSDRKWPGVVPKVGDRVHLARFCGIVVDGKDGRKYRLCHDTEITGVEV